MKKILFIDMFCEYGHNNINKIYINKLINNGYNVHVAMQKKYYDSLGLDQNFPILVLPDVFFKHKNNKILGRFNQIRLLNYIENKTNKSKYDMFFFSFFEEISFYLSGFNCKSILMVHGNAESLDNFIKRFFIKKIAKLNNVKFLVFSNKINEKFNLNKIYNSIVELHGTPDKIKTDKSILKNNFQLLLANKNHAIKEFNKYIFIPNSNKFGFDFLDNLLHRNDFIKFLNRENIYFIIKKSADNFHNNNIIILSEYLSEFDFETILFNTNIVFLNYPKTFEYRVSGLFFECISNNKILLLPRINSFTEFTNNFNYDPFFEDYENIQVRIIELLKLGENLYNDLNDFKPKLENLF